MGLAGSVQSNDGVLPFGRCAGYFHDKTDGWDLEGGNDSGDYRSGLTRMAEMRQMIFARNVSQIDQVGGRDSQIKT